MPIYFGAAKYFPKIFKHLSSCKDVQKLPITCLLPRIAFRYSTVVPKQFFDIFDIFTDVLFVNQSADLAPHLRPTNVIECAQPNRTMSHKFDELVANLDISNMQTTVKTLINELHTNIKLKDWDSVDKILRFFVDKRVVLNNEVIASLSDEFRNAGFIVGLKSLHSLTDVSETNQDIRSDILRYSAECNWRFGNVRECLSVLHDYYEEHPEKISSVKKLMRIIIHQSVSNHSEAVLFNVANFVQECSEKYQDLYPLIILWHDLFMSEWYSDRQFADTLLTKYDNLSTSVAMMASTLARKLIERRKCEDVYRLLEVLLKHKMKQSYGSITQMLYDYYCMKGDKLRCSEIIRSSVVLKIPLREEQYNSFISWSVSGNPYKFVKPVKVPVVQFHSRS